MRLGRKRLNAKIACVPALIAGIVVIIAGKRKRAHDETACKRYGSDHMPWFHDAPPLLD
jgi:hypothetical protein